MPKRDTFLPYCLPTIGEQEIDEVVDSIRAGWVTTGPKVKRFEEEFAAYIGVRNAIAVSSCTAALQVALAALDVGEGDEVIVPTLTFCATANVAMHLGARPVLVDVDQCGLMDPDAVRRAITPRTRAIIPVHYAGQACDLDELTAIADAHGIPLVEDAAHAAGCTYDGRKIGTRSRAVAFSFYATKNMTTGEGGMVTTDDDDLASRMRLLTLHGMSRDAWNRYTQAGAWYYEVVEPGYKFNMTDIQGSLGIHQLRRLDGFVQRRVEIAGMYDAAFEEVEELLTPVRLPKRNHVFHLYPIRVRRTGDLNRERVIEDLKTANIGTSVHFIPLHRHPAYSSRFGYGPDQFPVAESIYDEVLSLPLYPRMTDEDTGQVIEAVLESVATWRIRGAMLSTSA